MAGGLRSILFHRRGPRDDSLRLLLVGQCYSVKMQEMTSPLLLVYVAVVWPVGFFSPSWCGEKADRSYANEKFSTFQPHAPDLLGCHVEHMTITKGFTAASPSMRVRCEAPMILRRWELDSGKVGNSHRAIRVP